MMYHITNAKGQETFNYFKELDIVKQEKQEDCFSFESPFYKILDTTSQQQKFFLPRERFTHKGDYGHCLLIAGSYGKAGAAILASKAVMRTGCGLLTVHVPKLLYNIMQTSFPEAMIDIDNNKKVFSNIPNFQKYTCIAIGCGLDTKKASKKALISLLKKNKRFKKPIIIDADGLNILSTIPNFERLLSGYVILTPHIKEFERLCGKFTTNQARIEAAIKFARSSRTTLVLKDAITTIATSQNAFFNIRGNAGMATAGSGDVLTGIIAGVISQLFGPLNDDDDDFIPYDYIKNLCIYGAKLGVLIHAVAGDLAAKELGEKSLIASDIINYIPKAILSLSNESKNNSDITNL
jgi:hydroxyethylthiazole kinase-like uncharacterized protein yjeF